MNDDQLKNLVKHRIQNAIGGNDSAFSTERGDAMEYYLGEPLGNEVEGRSQVISTDVSDTVEQAMPALMRIFESGKAVEFEPNGEEDVKIAELATEYCNYVYKRDNNSFINTQTFIKDGLISKLGVLKVFWEEVDKFSTETINGVSEDELTMLLEELEEQYEGVDIVEQEEVELPQIMDPATGQPVEGVYDLMPTIHNVKLRLKSKVGKVRIEPVPPEEFIIDRNGRYIDMHLTGASYCGQRVPMTISELREMGVPDSVLDNLNEYEEDLTLSSDESQARRKNDEGFWQLNDGNEDPASRQVWVHELYMHVDYDGDGITEMRKIVTAGDEQYIIENEEIDYVPFSVYSPILMPHRIVGRSVAELVMDLQEIKTAMMRHYLDNIFSALNQSTAVNEDLVNLDDMLESRPDRIIRVEGDPNAAIRPISVPWMGNDIIQGMEYMDEIRNQRTGISDASAGVDTNTLANANTGVYAKFMERAQATIDLIARNVAEMGMKQVFKIILHIVGSYQNDPRTIRLNDEWTQVNPQDWPTDMDVTVKVGLGTGNKDVELAYLKEIIAAQKEALPAGLATRENIYAALTDAADLMGLPANKYFSLQPPQPQQPQKSDAQIMAEAEVAKNKQDADQDHEEMMHKTLVDLQEMALKHQVPLESLPAYQLLREQEIRVHTERAQRAQAEAMQSQMPQPVPGGVQ